MSENTTAEPLVIGEPHRHPAMRRLARACIALVRWQREQPAPVLATAEKPTHPTERRP